MIKYILECDKNHKFDSWFSDSKEFDKLNKQKLLECIYCNSRKISKSIMSPMIGIKNNPEDIKKINSRLESDKKDLKLLRNFIEKNFEYVGKNFSRKVREVYYDKESKKAIYGTASPEEREELAEEGIDILTIPWIDKDN